MENSVTQVGNGGAPGRARGEALKAKKNSVNRKKNSVTALED